MSWAVDKAPSTRRQCVLQRIEDQFGADTLFLHHARQRVNHVVSPKGLCFSLPVHGRIGPSSILE